MIPENFPALNKNKWYNPNSQNSKQKSPAVSCRAIKKFSAAAY